MFHVAFPRGQGPAYADLPPTLQPFAIAASVPPTDRLRTATFSGLIYLLIGAGVLALSSQAPHITAKPAPPVDQGRTVVFEAAPPRPLETVPYATGGPSSRPSEFTQPVPAPTPTADPTEAAAGLPTVDHSHDAVAHGPQRSAGPVQEGAGLPAAPSTPTVHDFTSVGLAILHRVDPIYPDFAKRAHIQGPVVLRMTVDEAGRPVQVQVLEGHPIFHEAAIQAARQWRFEPARMDGRSVSAAFQLTIKFALR
ncbi:energy transducer TonB [Geothrix sp. PMB-07]|uniref:energy transducer TonB n=1 Tax=Geothrix sp. PMB-07 TaxID=3068640 RepID=UPI002740E495|nr:energy transducer TonB [Geothrix sp. PMB-07]WLT32670.1 TonB family protein [Geothrix sp. PMB-07]